MSDLSATNCGCGCDSAVGRGGDCGCGFGGNNCLWIILLLCCCGGFGNNNGCGCGNDSFRLLSIHVPLPRDDDSIHGINYCTRAHAGVRLHQHCRRGSETPAGVSSEHRTLR